MDQSERPNTKERNGLNSETSSQAQNQFQSRGTGFTGIQIKLKTEAPVNRDYSKQRIKRLCVSALCWLVCKAMEQYLVYMICFPDGSDGKQSASDAGDLDSIPGWEDPLEKEIATYSNILAWRSPWTEKPSRLKSIGSHGAGHD